MYVYVSSSLSNTIKWGKTTAAPVHYGLSHQAVQLAVTTANGGHQGRWKLKSIFCT